METIVINGTTIPFKRAVYRMEDSLDPSLITPDLQRRMLDLQARVGK